MPGRKSAGEGRTLSLSLHLSDAEIVESRPWQSKMVLKFKNPGMSNWGLGRRGVHLTTTPAHNRCSIHRKMDIPKDYTGNLSRDVKGNLTYS